MGKKIKDSFFRTLKGDRVMTIFLNFLLQKNVKTHTDIYWQKLELKIHNGKIVNYSWFRGQSHNVFS